MIRALLVTATIAAGSVAAAPTAAADPMSDLIGMLPPGYQPDSCTGATQSGGLPSGVLVALDCAEVPGHAPAARYALHDGVGSLEQQFDVDFRGTYFTPLPCPGAPGIGPGRIAGGSGWKGRLACGTLQPDNKFAVMWTNESGPLWGRARGPNLIGLMDWFNNVIGPS